MGSDLKLKTVPAVADELGLPVQRVYAMVREGTIPRGVAVHFGRVVRIDAAALRAFIAAGGQTLSETKTRGRIQ